MEMCYDGRLVMPSNYVMMEEDEMIYVEGGGTFTLKVSCTMGGFTSGLLASTVSGFVTGYITGKYTRIGAFFGGTVAGIIAGLIGAGIGSLIASAVNRIVYGRGGHKSVTVFSCSIPLSSIEYDFDIGEKLGSFLGGMTGGPMGFALASAQGLAVGLVS